MALGTEWCTIGDVQALIAEPYPADAEITDAIERATLALDAAFCVTPIDVVPATPEFTESDAGAPTTLGDDGDLYADSDNGKMYLQVDGVWIDQGSADAVVEPVVFATAVPADDSGPLSVAIPNGSAYDLSYWDGDSWEPDSQLPTVTVPTGTPMWPDGSDGYPDDWNVRQATAILAAQVLTAAPPSQSGSGEGIIGETIGGYNYQTRKSRTSITALRIDGYVKELVGGYLCNAGAFQIDLLPQNATNAEWWEDGALEVSPV